MRGYHCLLAVLFSVGPATRAQEKPIDVPLSQIGSKYRLIGKLHEPLGTVVTLQGVIVEGPSKGYEGGPNICVRRINGLATQEDIQIKLSKGWTEFGVDLPKLESGTTLELKGYETGEFVGTPREALEELRVWPQVPQGLGFIHQFVYHKAKRTNPVPWSPVDFVDREALLEGRAVNLDKSAYITSSDWKLLIDPDAPWPKELRDKTVEGHGIIRKTNKEKTYRLDKGVTRLVKLEDQLGRKVALRGTAWSLNGEWWFDYRGIELYVENMKDLPKWSAYLHGKTMLIEGVLDEAMLPAVRQISLKSEGDLKKYFIVRKPSWKPIEALLAPERPR